MKLGEGRGRAHLPGSRASMAGTVRIVVRPISFTRNTDTRIRAFADRGPEVGSIRPISTGKETTQFVKFHYKTIFIIV